MRIWDIFKLWHPKIEQPKPRRPYPKRHREKCVCGREITRCMNGNFIRHHCDPVAGKWVDVGAALDCSSLMEDQELGREIEKINEAHDATNRAKREETP